METIHLIIICGTALLAVALFTLLPFLARKFEIEKKNEIEEKRYEANKVKTDFSDVKEELRNEIKASLGKDIPKFVNDKIDATLTERIKSVEEQIKLLAIKPKK